MEQAHSEIVVRNSNQLGHAIRRLRMQRGLSQVVLGKKASLRQPTVSDLENGKGQIRTLTEILAALDLELVVRPRTLGTDIDLEDLF